MVANYNSVPFDTRKPFDPSGVRLGTPAITSRGMGADEMKRLGNWMADVVDDVENEALISRVAGEIKDLCDQFPAPASRFPELRLESHPPSVQSGKRKK